MTVNSDHKVHKTCSKLLQVLYRISISSHALPKIRNGSNDNYEILLQHLSCKDLERTEEDDRKGS